MRRNLVASLVITTFAGMLAVAALARPAAPTPAAPAPTVPTVGPTGLATVLLRDTPFVRQEPDFCGEACVAMATARLGTPWSQDAVFAAAAIDPAFGRGAYTRELAAAVRRIGFDPGPVWSTASTRRPGPDLDAAFAALHADLARGVPSIVCMHYDDQPHTTEHFRLVTGYDAATDEVVYQEPAEDDGNARRMPRARFLALWPLPDRADASTIVRLALAPRELHAQPAAPPHDFTPAAYAQHVLALRERLAKLGEGHLTIRIEPPFVVLGDDPPALLAKHARIIRWAADALEAWLFDRRPARILDVFLFGSAKSFTRGANLLDKDPPDTPFGFYSPDADALIMNISTGGGTLVHELVHPYVEADVPHAPPWLNEGLGSLYEQADEKDGHIIGKPNWRLPGLQRALASGHVPSFRELTALDENAFYNDDTGVNYAASRYLLYWLQQRGLLRDFYRSFRDGPNGRTADPTGFAALSDALGTADADDVRADWEAFVRRLHFP